MQERNGEQYPGLMWEEELALDRSGGSHLSKKRRKSPCAPMCGSRRWGCCEHAELLFRCVLFSKLKGNWEREEVGQQGRR